MIDEVVQVLRNTDVRWSMDDVLAKLPSSGLQLAQSSGKRRTFESADGQRYSFYFSEAGQIRFAEATLEVFRDADTLKGDDYQKTLDEFAEKYELALKGVEALLGGGREVQPPAEMPHDRDALRLALWELDVADLMLELKHEDRNVPIRLVLTLAPSA